MVDLGHLCGITHEIDVVCGNTFEHLEQVPAFLRVMNHSQRSENAQGRSRFSSLIDELHGKREKILRVHGNSFIASCVALKWLP